MDQSKGWCSDPDGAFDAHCRNLSCEDWCKDNTDCPLQRKDQTMYISLDKNPQSLKTIEMKDVLLEVSEDMKWFKIIKHRYFHTQEKYHISQLKNVLFAGQKK
jgi:hypothetical protein